MLFLLVYFLAGLGFVLFVVLFSVVVAVVGLLVSFLLVYQFLFLERFLNFFKSFESFDFLSFLPRGLDISASFYVMLVI